MLLNYGVGEECRESLGLQGDHLQSYRRSLLGVHWKDWCWSWNSNTLATSCEESTHWKRPWCWEGLGAGGERDDREWDGWMASLTRWTWVWVNSGSLWWTERPGMLRFMGSQRVGQDWATELNWKSYQASFLTTVIWREKSTTKEGWKNQICRDETTCYWTIISSMKNLKNKIKSIKNKRERWTWYDIMYVWNLKYDTNESIKEK